MHNAAPMILALCAGLLCLVTPGGRSEAQESNNGDGGVSPTQGDDLARLRAHFGEQHFLPDGGFVLTQGQRLPDLVWENPGLVSQVVAHLGDTSRMERPRRRAGRRFAGR